MAGSQLSAGGPRKALCMGGVFAISTVIPGKLQHLAYHLETWHRIGADGVVGHGLQLVSCFVLLSVLIWASKAEGRAVSLLLAYPPHNRDTVLVHITGLVVGVALMLLR